MIDNVVKTSDVVNVIRCKICRFYYPAHVLQNDGVRRKYRKDDKLDIFGLGVTSDVGINVGGKCMVDANCGYGEDKSVFRNPCDYCSRGEHISHGETQESIWGIQD